MTTPLLFNAGAGRGKLRAALEARAARHGLELVSVDGAEEARRVAAELAATHPRMLVAGGDGTVHHAIRGADGADVTLGIVAVGTGNDFARALGLPAELEPALERALRAEPVNIDLGRAAGVPFAGIAGVGIVADVLTYLEACGRRYRGNWVYPWAVLRTVVAYRAVHVDVVAEADRFSGPVMMAAAANAPRFGGGMRAAPEASMRDGLLDIVVLKETSRAGLVRLLPRVYKGTHVTHPACRLFRAREARFDSRPAADIYADGERMPVRTSPETRLSVEPGRLRVAI
ncbi:MAG: YegS/Rv2252/BmrU family lipid kinase [Acidobacteria bacterium]|nr:YegS/Rv2252/BmrU family lipid kinase [Acidobacteriota bacterium]NIM60281.1 YegS/Rv2252/BmrU family lipid kinase [Acidobacteriota bacterium]NIO57884.1 YegS/Rv2252/BmrU family lipid kinase [Acidobacteriota bacterium]NIQ28893.1 YegS/Rv2252/BmrU family lipid kinase [Acidobacteriota bacterium]NIQ83351.1 YegS/Rv2252/BmrU family lipid kinase [Acidobacteriota bacterium]